MLSDAIITMSSLNLIAGEMDADINVIIKNLKMEIKEISY